MIIRKFWMTILWFLLILYGSFTPKNTLNPEWFLFKHQDKVIHSVLYGVLMILFLYNYSSYSQLQKRVFVYASVSFICISFCIEILQPILSQRSFEFADILSNAIGLFLGMAGYRLIFYKR
ncbi:MAG TPA: VanZ family protein [Bacteroidales bacterium]|nr:VanZ family protein [Bacteroidales bacterium]